VLVLGADVFYTAATRGTVPLAASWAGATRGPRLLLGGPGPAAGRPGLRAGRDAMESAMESPMESIVLRVQALVDRCSRWMRLAPPLGGDVSPPAS